MGLALFLTDCSVEKNTGSTRFYHSLTSRYNYYFNGYESFKAGLNKINTSYSDDFSEILKVFEFSDPAVVPMVSSDMDRAINKASQIITLKSITAKPEARTGGTISEKERKMLERKEFNEWVDDSYLLIAKARFYRHEFREAASVFNFCLEEASDPGIRTESALWLARISNETGQFSESMRILRENEEASLSSKSLRGMYLTTLADLFVRQKRYSEAIDPLTSSIRYISGKRQKYRLTYLLAQLHEQTGNPDKAISLYRDVVRMNIPYEVEFNARINIAGVFDVNSGNPREMRKQLEKMLRDSKNNEYHDQIYYALANLAMKEGNTEEAVRSYRKSASSSAGNQNQKAKSYLALAEYYYSVTNYPAAGKYYDSAAFFIDQRYPSYREIREKSQDLGALTEHLNIITREDSLQRVASMSESERNTFIAQIINQIVSDEAAGRRSEFADRYNLGQFYENERRFQTNIQQEGKWYFYNQAALTFGRTEFRRRWGERRLEDNWRRGNRTTISYQASSGQNENNGAAAEENIQDYKTPQFYLQNLPLTDSLRLLSDNKIAYAYLNAGKVLSERINDQPEAVKSFESLLKRYPGSDLVPETLYSLYRLFREKENNNQRAEIYRQRLTTGFPESEYAMIVSDPDYFRKKLAVMKRVEQLYQTAYNLYLSEDFTGASNVCDNALKEFPDDALAPKFLLLRAYSKARISDERTLREELSGILKNHPGTEEAKRAEELMAFIDKRQPELKVEEEKVIATELYTADYESPLIFVLIIMDPAFNINQASFDVISHNIDNYTNMNYRTEGMLTDKRYFIIKVTGFQGNGPAWEYYSASRDARFLRNPSGARIMTFLITAENLKVLETDRNPERYYIFFNENYLKRETK